MKLYGQRAGSGVAGLIPNFPVDTLTFTLDAEVAVSPHSGKVDDWVKGVCVHGETGSRQTGGPPL